MIQFTQQEIARLRQKVTDQPHWLEKLKAQCAAVQNRPHLVPTEGIANWGLYYYCPDCSEQLIYDPAQPFRHECPQCGRVFTGEPYDSSWWWYVNMENAGACRALALLYLLTGNEAYGKSCVELMDTYARNYPNYQEHGDIPYNGPGLCNAQTLDEANLLRTFAVCYDLTMDCMTAQQAARIRDDMLLPGARFLCKNRHAQIHNHEVMVNSGIAVIGILFDQPEMIRFAVEEKYGLRYQLEHGVLPDDMWFERATGYHFASLMVFMEYEKFALHTPYSMLQHPRYKAMLARPLSYILPDGTLPMLGDTSHGHTGWEFCSFYEFLYRYLPGEPVLQALHLMYRTMPRNSLDALLYGVDELPDAPPLALKNYCDRTGHGSTVLHGADGTYLLFKHDCYGGEHDHYDRLGIDYRPFGKRICPDLGTVGYGARLHYDYYKNTGTHNLVVVNGKNQPPARGTVVQYDQRPNGVAVTAETDWCTPYPMPDSFTIVQWDEESYRDVTLRRSLLLGKDYLAEVFVAQAPKPVSFDWNMHFCGESLTRTGEPVAQFAAENPYCHFTDAVCEPGVTDRKDLYRCGDVTTALYSHSAGMDCFTVTAPDNPSYITLTRTVQRTRGQRAVFAHLLHSWKDAPAITDVAIRDEEGVIRFELTRADGSSEQFVWNGTF